MKIRKATIEDIKNLRNLSFKLYNDIKQYDKFLSVDFIDSNGCECIKNNINSADKIYWIAEQDTKAIGYVLAKINKEMPLRPYKRTELCELYIDENFRRKGIGGMLVKEFLKWSKELGVKSTVIGVLAKNKYAISFYEKRGFIPESILLEQQIR